MILTGSARSLSSEEQVELGTIMRKRGLTEREFGTAQASLSVVYEQRGRMTLCLLLRLLPYRGVHLQLFWGACRKDMRDGGNVEVGKRVAFAKAVKDYISYLHLDRPELLPQVRLTARNVRMLEAV